MNIPFTRVIGQISLSHITDNTRTNAKINSLDWSKVTSTPSTFQSKNSTHTIYSNTDYGGTYKTTSLATPSASPDATTKTM